MLFRSDSPSGSAIFHGASPIPERLNDGAAVTPGLYYVSAACFCDALASCPGGGFPGPPAFGRYVLLAPQPFCVTDPGHPCLGWGYWLVGTFGAELLFSQRWIDEIGAQFAPQGLPPSPPPPTTSTTTRRKVTVTTTTPTTTPETEPVTEPTTPPCKKGDPPPCP